MVLIRGFSSIISGFHEYSLQVLLPWSLVVWPRVRNHTKNPIVFRARFSCIYLICQSCTISIMKSCKNVLFEKHSFSYWKLLIKAMVNLFQRFLNIKFLQDLKPTDLAPKCSERNESRVPWMCQSCPTAWSSILLLLKCMRRRAPFRNGFHWPSDLPGRGRYEFVLKSVEILCPG